MKPISRSVAIGSWNATECDGVAHFDVGGAAGGSARHPSQPSGRFIVVVVGVVVVVGRVGVRIGL